jgi:cation diffusion facilitator CzcD-associated flavoprotein CzcO
MFRYVVCLMMVLSVNASGALLEDKIQRELELFNLPAPSWRMSEGDVCDVAIIGAGQAGICIAHALELEGINNVQVFDGAKEGEEGPWLTTARMKTLRSGKYLRGPAQLPHLTFRAWCEAKYGKTKWESLTKIPTNAWGKYLQWLKKSLNVQVCNGWSLEKIEPNVDDTLTLTFAGNNKVVRCRKVVLATGRTGFGGAEIPEFIKAVPKKFWGHTSERIDPQSFKNKKVAVVGVGASAFDIAAVALENGAKGVQMLMRRDAVPTTNHAAPFGYPGFMRGFYYLSDQERMDYFSKVLESGIPPPQESIERLQPFTNFEIIKLCQIKSVQVSGNQVVIETAKEPIIADFVALATGYGVDGSNKPELRSFVDKIKLWQDKMPEVKNKMGRFPYLGPHFEFLEKEPGSASFLRNIHCFNYGGFLSHGRICGDIDGVHVGIQRLVDGIAVDMFLQDTCRNGEPTPHECPGTCQIGLCSPFSLTTDSDNG